ncbi:MAG: general secretion pathway protein A [Hyphomicrobiaceae bacterium]|jgi:general secretion pathway protein A
MLTGSMYEAFFGLKDQPFRLTPDPDYLFMSAKHREAFAHLLYGVNEGSGFVAITGEVGAGKTTLVRALLREAESNVTVIYIVNPVLTSTELLQTINSELGLPSSSTSRKELVEALARFLRDNQAKGGRTVIIVDEAQNLDPVVLEQLRLLSNLETETEKLIQIVLVGQPELRTLLERHDLRQLNQRVTVRWHLDKLDRAETFEYVRHRMGVAGATTDLFEPRAVDLIYRYSDGVPRLINILGHRALLVAFTRSKGKVGPAEIAGAAKELGHGSGPVRTRGGRQIYQVATVVALAVTVGFAAFYMVTPAGFAPVSPAAKPLMPARLATQTAAVDSEASAPEQPVAEPPTVRPSELAAAAPAVIVATPTPVASVEVPAPEMPTVADAATPVGEVEFPSAPAVPADPVAGTPTVVEAPAAEVDTPEVVPEVVVAEPTTPPLLTASQGATALASRSAFELAADSLSRLLYLWEAPALGPLELRADALDLAAIADSRSLRYMSAQMTPAFLAALDLPAVLEIDIPARGESAYVLLERYDREANEMTLVGGRRLAADTVLEWWTGRTHIVWHDTHQLGANLGPGSGGPRVRTLQTLLREIGIYDGPSNAKFDALTENSVRRFQETRHVVADGIAGPVTQILLYNSLSSTKRPRLSGEDGAGTPGLVQ